MSPGKYGCKEKRSYSFFSSMEVVVFVAFFYFWGAWVIMFDSAVPTQRVSLHVSSTHAKVKKKFNDSQYFEDSQGDLPDNAIKGDGNVLVQEVEKTSWFDQKTQSL
jgi:hypothetical protein